MEKLEQKLDFWKLGEKPLAELLQLESPPFMERGEAHRQLSFVEKHVRELGAKLTVVENRYVDRDYMEEHSVFYSKNLVPYHNWCQRLHFFRMEGKDLKGEFRRLRGIRDKADFQSECEEFSTRHYLGFSVIKPLPGCPVGRTVLRPFPEDASPDYQREFKCVCLRNKAHLLGIPLSVTGLPFQQQDLGVSACATTALWSALQRARELEESGTATPAQITLRASQFTLPSGRAMPSEGLSVDQMCQAVHSFGYAPILFRAEDFESSRGVLYATVRSGISPVLILEQSKKSLKHAVAVAGIKLRKQHEPDFLIELIDARSNDMAGLYIHDDRFGPYLTTQIEKHGNRLLLHVPFPPPLKSETWLLSHILIPMHAKIRLSFGDLRKAAIHVVRSVHSFRANVMNVPETVISWDSRIIRAHNYVEEILLFGEQRVSDLLVERLCAAVCFSRYLALVRIRADDLDPIDVLLDTTSTERNLTALAVVRIGNSQPNTAAMAALLGKHYDCPVIVS